MDHSESGLTSTREDSIDRKHIILGVSGSIAAYKACTLASLLVKAGACVHPVLTRGGARFITLETMAALCGRPVLVDEFDQADPREMSHIALAERADAVVLAPASANLIARLAAGMANDMLTLLLTVTRSPILLAPAMNTNMWTHPIVTANVERLLSVGYEIVQPASGRLACGTIGAGKLAEPEEIFAALLRLMERRSLRAEGDLAACRILVTAGPTREPIDAVRFLGNRSSGKMGYALAAAARNRGASVLLISGPTHLQAPPGVETVQVLTASQMRDAVRQNLAGVDIVIAAAAVADFTIDSPANSKLRRSSGPLTLNLKPTVDILAEIGADKGGRYHVGFAAEVGDPVPSAREKLAAKNLDLVVANDVAARDSGFDVDTNRVVMIGRDVPDEPLPLLAKSEVAERILDRIVRDRASTTQPLIHSAVSAGP